MFKVKQLHQGPPEYRKFTMLHTTAVGRTHSSCKAFRMAGMLVADGGLGLTSGEPVTQSDTEVYNQYNYKVQVTDTLGTDL